MSWFILRLDMLPGRCYLSVLSGLCYLVCVLVGSSQLSEVIQQFFIQLLVFICCVSFISLLFITSIILSQTSVLGLQLNT